MRKILPFFIVMFLSFPLYAQGKGYPKIFTLSECLRIAKENNPLVKTAEANLSTSGAELTYAFGTFLPTINFNMGYTRQLNIDVGQKINIGGQTIVVGKIEPNSYNMGLSITYNLFNGLSREAYYNQAKDNLNSAFLSYNRTLEEIELSVYRAYINVLNAKKILEIRKKDYENATKELERTKAYHEAGAIPITNLLTQEAALASKEIEIIQAENNYYNAKAQLMIAIGSPPNLDFEISEDEVPQKIDEEEISKTKAKFSRIEEIMSVALARREDYKAVNLRLNAAKSNIIIAKSSYFPTLSAYGGWNWANNEFNKFSELGRSYVGLSLQLPIFSNFQTNYQIELAKSQLVQIEAQKIQIEQKIRSEIIQAINNLEFAEKQIIAANHSLQSARKNYENIEERYRIGMATVTDYVLANNMFISAHINQISSINYYYLCRIELQYAIGQIENK
ncbi:MAG: TolC family protein [Candidatus Kapaibacteriales bacterium]